jgi:beta-glucanase (GH16 family)
MTYQEATYDSTNGVAFTITESGDAPTMASEFYFFFGTVSVVAKAANGTGIVSCFILESDDLDEIDWEWLGGDIDQVQTNYFGKGNTTSYDRGTYVTVGDSQTTWHNYTLDWTSSATTWYLDGVAVRTLNYADALDGQNYPQTPMRIKLGTWVASDTGAEGTIEWAGGETDFDDEPFVMYVQSIDITNANPASTYTYGDMTGSFDSIELDVDGAETSNATSTGSISSDVANVTGTSSSDSSSSTSTASADSSSSTASSSSSASDSSSTSSSTSGSSSGSSSSSTSSGFSQSTSAAVTSAGFAAKPLPIAANLLAMIAALYVLS